MLNAARHLFTTQGFGGTSMDAIAAEAAVSKATLYAYFSSKEDLFTEVVASDGERYVHLPKGDNAVDPIADVLNGLAHDLASLILSPETIAIYRIVMAESVNFPDLGTCFYQAGPKQMIGRVADCLASAMDRRALRHAPAGEAASNFIALVLGELQLRALLQVGGPIEQETRAQVARRGVEVFLRAYAPD